MRILKTIFAITLFCTFIIVQPSTTYAQNDDDAVKSLSEILNPDINRNAYGNPQTAQEMANQYFATCNNDKMLSFSPTEKETLCACMSAHMSETLTLEEFRALKTNNAKGRDARSKALAYGFTPCMNYVMEPRVKVDCYTSKNVSNLITGKKGICECTAKRFAKHFQAEIPHVIREATRHEPMTLNPLEYYFVNGNYDTLHKMYLEGCFYEYRYSRDNR